MTKPSERVHDVFRKKDGGKVDISTNSKPGFDNFHVDRSRLGTHERYDHEAPNEWGGTGRMVREQNHIMHNVRRQVGDLKFKSSNCNCETDSPHDCEERNRPWRDGRNPMDRRGRHE